MISRNTIRYCCPIEYIPTKDNVRVSLDIGINFHIGRNDHLEEDGKKFFYNFGPNRLEELLQQESDEAIRNFCRNIKVNKIRDVKTELTHEILANLTKKFEPYGVVIEHVSIIKVILPRDLRQALMFATNYDVYLQKQVKHQQNKLLVINNDCNKNLLQIKRDNM